MELGTPLPNHPSTPIPEAAHLVCCGSDPQAVTFLKNAIRVPNLLQTRVKPSAEESPKASMQKWKYHGLRQVCPSRDCHKDATSHGLHPTWRCQHPVFSLLHTYTMVAYHFNRMNSNCLEKYFTSFLKLHTVVALYNIANTVTFKQSYEAAKASSITSLGGEQSAQRHCWYVAQLS